MSDSSASIDFDRYGRPNYSTVSGGASAPASRSMGARSQRLSVPGADDYIDITALAARGIHVDGATMHVPLDALREVQRQRIRAASSTRVPKTPQQFMREAGGGVRKGHGIWRTISMNTLRAIRERSPLIQTIHSARAYQIRRICREWSGKRGDVGWRVVHKDHTKWDALPPEGFEKWVARGQRFIKTPTPGKTLADLTGAFMEDLMTINRPVCEPKYSIYDRDYLVGFDFADGALVWPTFAFIERWMQINPKWGASYQGYQLSEEDALLILSEQVGLDLYAYEYVVVQDDRAIAGFKKGELIVAPIVNRTDVRVAGYPPSHVEQAAELIMAFVSSFDYNSSFFTRGWMPEFLLGVKGAYHDEDLDAITDMLREAALGVENAWKPPIIPMGDDGGLEKIDLKANNKDMLYETWLSALIALTAAVYRMDPSIINAKLWSGGEGGGLNEGSRFEEIKLANDDGIQGDLGHLTDHIYNPMLSRIHPDLMLQWMWGDYDPKKDAEVIRINVEQVISRNEARLQLGMKPKGFWVVDEELETLSPEDLLKYEKNPWNMPSDPAFAEELAKAHQVEHAPEVLDPHGYNETEPEPVGGAGGFGGGGGSGGDPRNGNGNGNGKPTSQLEKGQHLPRTVIIEPRL